MAVGNAGRHAKTRYRVTPASVPAASPVHVTALFLGPVRVMGATGALPADLLGMPYCPLL